MKKGLPPKGMEWHIAVQYMLESPRNVVMPDGCQPQYEHWMTPKMRDSKKIMRIFKGVLEYRITHWPTPHWVRCDKYTTMGRGPRAFPTFTPYLSGKDECGDVELPSYEAEMLEQELEGFPNKNQLMAVAKAVVRLTHG